MLHQKTRPYSEQCGGQPNRGSCHLQLSSSPPPPPPYLSFSPPLLIPSFPSLLLLSFAPLSLSPPLLSGCEQALRRSAVVQELSTQDQWDTTGKPCLKG